MDAGAAAHAADAQEAAAGLAAPAEPAAAEAAAAGEELTAAEEEQSKEEEKKTPKAAAKPRTKATPASVPAAGTDTGGRARRERKQVDRFQVEAKKEAEEVAIPEGTGDKLRDIPNIAFKMGKLTGKDELIEGLHMVLYRRKGTANQRKKAVLDFCGFAFAEDQQAKEVEARKASLGKWKLDLLHRLMDTLDVSRGSGDKTAKIDRVLEFLQAPKALSDVDLAAKEADKKAKEKAKRERAAAKKEKEKAKKEKEKAKQEKAVAAKRKSAGAASRPAKKPKKEAESEPEDEPESESEEEASEEEGSDFEAEIAPKKAAGGSASKRGRRASAADEHEQAAAAEGEGPAAMEEDEQPVEDPASKVPADELRREVEAILAAVPSGELRSITAKPILKQLEAKYGFSLRPRKQEIVDLAHAYVVQYYEEHPEAAAEVEEAEAAAAEAQDQEAPAPEAPAAEAEPAAEEVPAADDAAEEAPAEPQE